LLAQIGLSQEKAMSEKIEIRTLRRFRNLMLAASIITFLLIVMGGIVRVSESGQGCPDWPLCYGRLLPPLQPAAIIEYTHRLIASLTTPIILISALIAWMRFRSVRLIIRPMMAALGFLLIEIVLGAVTVVTKTPPVIVAIHLGVALTVLALLLTVTVAAFRLSAEAPLPSRLDFSASFSRLGIWTLIGTFVVLLSGVFVAGSEATKACIGWPLCNGRLFPTDLLGWIQMTHRFIVALVSLLVLFILVQAWRTQRTHSSVYPAAAVSGVLFFAQAFVGALNTTQGFPVFDLALHVATAAATWAALVVLVVVSATEPRQGEAEERAPSPASLIGYVRDLFTLTRPLVVLLLLVTAYAAMVVGGHALPPLGLAFWTLLGGGLAAGGAQAVNQYVDRDIDRLMMRTAKRPIPAGRLTPGEGLAWGFSLCLVSLYLLAGFVGWLAAALTLVGIIYYVLIYTLLLKRTSVQNIVIGGGAGAMAPVVGLVAASGHLTIWAVFLFAIVFLWTPPHFWALAIVRLIDYKRANIPVMPVVRGEEYTRTRILVYSVVLVAVTLLPFVFKVSGLIYLVSAIVLGGFLIYAAWEVARNGGNRNAWRLYRISSLYLAFLFLAMMVNALI
jgi:protoheme IX farnesyltransferase